MVEDNLWKAIPHRSLAKWIAETPAYNGKTIVLLSWVMDVLRFFE